MHRHAQEVVGMDLSLAAETGYAAENRHPTDLVLFMEEMKNFTHEVMPLMLVPFLDVDPDHRYVRHLQAPRLRER
jgi:hypothetical protein